MNENEYLSHSAIVYLVKFDESYQTNFANSVRLSLHFKRIDAFME